jgi:hypothetical protein
MSLRLIRCEQCEKEMATRYQRQRFCSDKCCRAHYRKLKPALLQCPVCKSNFAPSWPTQVYCSPICRERNEHPISAPRVCAECGITYIPTRNVAIQRFCSTRCRLQAKRKRLSPTKTREEKPQRLRREDRPLRHCRECGRELLPVNGQRPRSCYCSEACRAIGAQKVAAAYYRRMTKQCIARSAANQANFSPRPCAHCGAEPAEKHHPDYNKPLEVVWLCRRCHQRLHDALRHNSRATSREVFVGAGK